MPITVHPPPVDDVGAAGFAEASSSSAAAALPALDSMPQDLQAALPSSSAPLDPATGLPEYERPPEYDQVLGMTTENDAAESNQTLKGKAVAS